MHRALLHNVYIQVALAVLIAFLSAPVFLRLKQNFITTHSISDSDLVSGYQTPNDVAYLHPSHAAAHKACLSLSTQSDIPVYDDKHPIYQQCTSSYYSAHALSQHPSCIIQPRTTSEVSTAIQHLKSHFDAAPRGSEPQLAIRSGGHAFEGNFSSIHGGIVLDLMHLNSITLSPDHQTTRLGPAARWRSVSSKLDALGLAVAGGRNSHVGVGGLVLGGGISFLSPQYGMVCDQTVSFEVVLANSSIITASSTSHPALYRALKGGANNFGVVTSIVAATRPGTRVWGGYFYWPWSAASQLLDAFHAFNMPDAFDSRAAGPIFSLAYAQSVGVKLAVGSLLYTAPEAWPACFDGFRRIWRYWSTARVQSLTDATDELDSWSPHARRTALATTTVRNSRDVLLGLEDIFLQTIEHVKHVRGLAWPLTVQPLPPRGVVSGRNVLGLEGVYANASASVEDEGGPLVIVLASPTWKYPEDDETVRSAALGMIGEVERLAAAHGAATRYKYLNYAASEQDPLAGYGEENVRFMRRVAREYDPDGFFQRGVPGGFKLFT